MSVLQSADSQTLQLIHKINDAYNLLLDSFAINGEGYCRKSRNSTARKTQLNFLSEKMFGKDINHLNAEEKKELETLFKYACDKYLYGYSFSTDIKKRTKKTELDIPLYHKVKLPKNKKLYTFYSLFKNPTKEILSFFEIKNKGLIEDIDIEYSTPANLDKKREILLQSINDFEPFHVQHIKLNGLNEYSIIDNKSNSFEMRKTIVEAVDYYENNKDKIDSVSEIPIYFVIVVGAQRGIHASIIVLYDSNIYTIGFGYSGYIEKKGLSKLQKSKLEEFVPKKASLYSPDYLINEALDNNIVDIGILKKSHVRKLESYIKKSRTLKSMLKTFVAEDPNDHKLKEYLYFFDEKQTNVLFDKHFLTDMDDIFYSQISNENIDQAANCASFVNKIFPNISCSRFKIYSDPKFCQTNPPLSEDKIDNIINLYLDGNVSMLTDALKPTVCKKNDCAIMGGKQKKNRTVKKKSGFVDLPK